MRNSHLYLRNGGNFLLKWKEENSHLYHRHGENFLSLESRNIPTSIIGTCHAKKARHVKGSWPIDRYASGRRNKFAAVMEVKSRLRKKKKKIFLSMQHQMPVLPLVSFNIVLLVLTYAIRNSIMYRLRTICSDRFCVSQTLPSKHLAWSSGFDLPEP